MSKEEDTALAIFQITMGSIGLAACVWLVFTWQAPLVALGLVMAAIDAYNASRGAAFLIHGKGNR